uniref:Gamma-tubulin complex component 3 homolog n=1 Tax=Sinocyclocheilus grahami TaxID=75366 RepID=A0A672PMP9_SINGR
MAALDQKSPNVLLQNLCCKITGKSEADVAHQFQYAVRVIGSNYAPTIERDEFLVSEKIKKELLKQRREADAALFSELHRKLQTQGVLKHRWSILYLLLSLCEDPRKPSNPAILQIYHSNIMKIILDSDGLIFPYIDHGLQRRDGDGSGECLLRDILYVFQGIDGKFIKMCSPENCYKIDSKYTLGRMCILHSQAPLTFSSNLVPIMMCFLPFCPLQVLLIGKSINFLHQVCHDRTPPGKIMPASKSTDSPKDAVELFTDLEGAFQSNIDAAYFETSKYLLDVLNKNYQLLEHLQAMRRYLLLGQGDFIRHLMDLLKPELVRAATTLYQHNLTGILETAVRATNAQFDSPEILKRLDVRLLEVSPGDTGWHVFSLDYHVEGPIATVFTRECMSHYLRVFNFLWRAKRMEYILTDIWKGQMCNAKLLKSMPELSGVLHQCHVLASEMVHFIHQMQYYITFEVLECSWDELWNKVQQAQDLDHIIAAHDVFLDSIISRCLLDVNNRSLLNQLRAVFDQIIEFQNAQDTLYRSALEELQLRIQFEDKKRQREEMGEWGVTAEQEAEENRRVQEFKDTIPKMCSQLRLLTHFYQGIVQEFLRLLMTDESLQFLSFRLDFNEHYKARDPRLRPSLGATRGRRSSNI